MRGLPIRQVLGGWFSPSSLRAFLTAVMAAIAVLLGMAWAVYDLHNPERHYNILVNQISDLGNPEHNPAGFLFFSCALWTLAVAAVPLLRFYRRVLPWLDARVTGVFVIFFAIGIPGTVLVGFFPSSLNSAVHLASAALAFGGIGLAFFLAGVGMIASKARVHNAKIPNVLVIASVAFIAFVATGFAVVGYTFALDIFEDVEGTWLSFSLWEWFLLGSVCAMCAATSIPLVRSTWTVNADTKR